MPARAFSPEGLAVGVCLVGVGVLWLLSNLGRIELLDTLRMWWPVSLIVWGGLDLAGFYLDRLSGRS